MMAGADSSESNVSSYVTRTGVDDRCVTDEAVHAKMRRGELRANPLANLQICLTRELPTPHES
ncbi:hypothetical protein A1Q1_03860 [Trichosporon asahii var. asahii CBS 2479]|uniref:Uncharacterized protein n=1 Tax=Trichosporon asahii var. asahii (strain ATCC 90039 / CBS 2479 / JCM 2466 / KCTC 7840 / NBRC 103889/ NCYC 2677 / UAMH 7654) TaxID=1186058 RepID=J6ES80_TRIAS|nr:hypothetical protein A1Q1_03860 [Trichosporon asahii var. asahii CBS 2479]EJT47389.1 hypothetical protein A1Q1_03860 [Trichosporon asahii var. asahii CBS 2479]